MTYYVIARYFEDDMLLGPFKTLPAARKAAALAETKKGVAYARLNICLPPKTIREWDEDEHL